MKLGVVSDTHDNIEKAEAAVKFFEQQEVGAVIHCGDIIAPFTAQIFDADFDFYCVRGNNDGEWNLKETVEEFGEFHNNIAELEFNNFSFAVYHGTEEEIVEALVESGKYDYVLRGHTHEKKIAEQNGTVELNPGGIQLPGQDEKLHVATIAESGEVEIHRIEP